MLSATVAMEPAAAAGSPPGGGLGPAFSQANCHLRKPAGATGCPAASGIYSTPTQAPRRFSRTMDLTSAAAGGCPLRVAGPGLRGRLQVGSEPARADSEPESGPASSSEPSVVVLALALQWPLPGPGPRAQRLDYSLFRVLWALGLFQVGSANQNRAWPIGVIGVSRQTFSGFCNTQVNRGAQDSTRRAQAGRLGSACAS